MSYRQIIKSRNILCIVPDKERRKRSKTPLNWSGPMHPATILQQHPRTTILSLIGLGLALSRPPQRLNNARRGGLRPCQNSLLKEQIAASGSIM